jgi:hypothetical protein
MMALTIADTHWATFPVSTVNYSNITSDRNADAVQKSCFGKRLVFKQDPPPDYRQQLHPFAAL